MNHAVDPPARQPFRSVAVLAVGVIITSIAALTLSPGTASASNGCGPAGTTKINIPKVFLPALGPFAPYGAAIDLAPIYVKTANLVPDKGPFFNFTSACNAHDDCYGTWLSNKPTCDSHFLAAMRANCKGYSGARNTACNGLANTYYQAVHNLGQHAWLGPQIEPGLHRILQIKATGPPTSTTSPFARFTFLILNGMATSEYCTFDGIAQACSPAPTYIATKKGTHRATFQVKNYARTVTKMFTWTIH